jgi:flagellar biosynthesis/type III secretory pathway M-ring protein FliF/YscJ
MSDKVWQILGLLTATGFVFMALFLIWVWIESELHARRMRKMREEADRVKERSSYAAWPQEEGNRVEGDGALRGYRARVKRAQFLMDDP